MLTAIREQVTGMETLNAKQVHAAATEINEKYILQGLAANGGKEAEAAVVQTRLS